VREEGVLLEDVADAPVLGGQVDAAVGVEQDAVAEGHEPALRAHRPGDRPEDRRLPGAGGPHQRHGLAVADVERYPELEVAKRNVDVESESRQWRSSFRPRRTTALTTTSRPPIARATSKSMLSAS
jgi:hypothetical protein